MRIFSAILATFAVVGATLSQSAVAASSAYYSSTVTPTIYSKNLWYSAAPAVVGRPPSTATINVVYYKWSYSYPRPSGHQVLLCNNTGAVCFDVTRWEGGSVDFTGTGVKANTPLRIYSRVSGTKTMSPLYGSNSTVSVNYTY
jgi:hypothetical protein